ELRGDPVDLAPEPRVPAQDHRHRIGRLDGQRRLETAGDQHDRLGDASTERPIGPELGLELDAVLATERDLPRAIEDRAVDGVRWHRQRELIRPTAEQEPAVPDPPGERHHRIAAPPERAGAVRDEDLAPAHHERCDPATGAGVDREGRLIARQDDAIRLPRRAPGHPTVMARPGRNRYGGREAGEFQNGRTSGCRSIRSWSAMKARRAWMRDQASG